MSISQVNLSQVVTHYGVHGKETTEKMINALKALGLSIAYNDIDHKFTINSSSRVPRRYVKQDFKGTLTFSCFVYLNFYFHIIILYLLGYNISI